jgi:DnaJ-class molecular chaperone
MPPKFITCPDCGGDGEVEVQHPRWGSPTCAEPWINIPCPTCEGAGEIEAEEEDEDEPNT